MSASEHQQAATQQSEPEELTEEALPEEAPPPEEAEVAEAIEEPAIEEKAEEEEIEVVEERTYTLPFREVWRTPRQRRAPRAVRMLREYARRHMKVEDVLLSNEVNEQIWARGIRKPPRRLRVRMVKDREGRVTIYPAKGE